MEKKDYKQEIVKLTKNVKDVTLNTSNKVRNTLDNTQESIVKAMDENGAGKIDIEDIIIMGLKVPGVKINRAEFLRKELFKNYPEEVIDDAIKYNPSHANIPVEEIDKIADQVIKYERNCVSGISTALGMPGGVAMVATIPADIAQYYGYMIRATQKLMYLYGFPEIDVNENKSGFDSATIDLFGKLYPIFKLCKQQMICNFSSYLFM